MDENLMMYGVAYLVICGVAAIAGADKRIGSTATFFISAFLTPVAGVICAFLSEDMIDHKIKRAQQLEYLNSSKIKIKDKDQLLKDVKQELGIDENQSE